MKNIYYFENNQNKMVIRADLKRDIKRAVDCTLELEQIDKSAEISVTFMDDEKIHALNKEYRDKDKPTDVLSFPMYDNITECEQIPLVLGDIVISVQTAAKQARELGHSVNREIAFLCVHSTLHLLGYDHELSEADDEDMCARQREVIKKVFDTEE